MIKKKVLSQEDRKIWEDYIKDPSDIYDKEKNNQKKKILGSNLIFTVLLWMVQIIK